MIFQAHVPAAWPFKRESFLKDDTRRDHDNLKDARVHSRLIFPSLASQTLLFWSLHIAATTCKTSQFFTTTGFRRIVSVCDPAPGTSTSRACRPQSLQRAAGQRCSAFNDYWQWCWILNIEQGILLNVWWNSILLRKKINQQSLHVAAGQRSQLLHLSVWFACGKYQKQGMACQM